MAQANTISRPFSYRWLAYFGVALLAIAAGAAVIWQLPQISAWVKSVIVANDDEPDDTSAEPAEDEHDHGNPDALELSEQARRNIALKTGRVELQSFERTLSIPGIVVERPGQSVFHVTAPLTGVVTRVYVTEGEAVTPNQKLFDVRLTHEDVVQSQADFLRAAQELDVIRQDVKRLEGFFDTGAIAGKRVVERRLEQEKQEAALRAQREALLLHGLSDEQIDGILTSRKLLPAITVFAPEAPATASAADLPVLQVQKLSVQRGQHVATGDSLASLAGYGELLIEGRAFEQDAPHVSHAITTSWPVTAIVEGEKGQGVAIEGLQILYVASQVDPESRALHFYIRLPNELIRDSQADGRRFIVWRFKPGQRMQIRVPVEKWQNRIVLPIDAVAQDGAETYIFRVNGDQLIRQPVHIEFRDQFSAVIASDGSVYPGEEVALNGAYQLLVALKNQSGGGVDPHAGHHH
jgi:multidrug efflux pump subunit AcrA (membrane-fusion protein)